MKKTASAARSSDVERVAKPLPEKGARDRIVEAACDVLAKRGSHEASVKEIAKAAGVAPGLVHYYFASKAELLLEVVRASCTQYNAEVEALVVPRDPRERARFLLAWTKQRGLESPDWYRLMVDLDALALRDPVVALEVGRLRVDVRARTTLLVSSVEAELGVALASSAGAVASVLIAAVDGLTVHKLIDPDFALDDAFDALIQMVEGLMVASPKARAETKSRGAPSSDARAKGLRRKPRA